MDLASFAQAIREYQPIQRKAILLKVIRGIAKARVGRGHIFSDFGEDSAAIRIGGHKLGLIATDGIMSSFVEKNPRGAGYAAILVCIDDIFACGGTPLAASIVISARNEAQLDDIVAGLNEGSEKFQVPVVRGHTHPEAPIAALSSTILGTVAEKTYVSAGGAKPNNVICIFLDADGRRSPYNPLIWDTTTMKNKETILAMRQGYLQIIKKHLLLSAKDISNAGIFGTLLQMLEFSGCGAEINLEQLKVPPSMAKVGITSLEMAKMFLTSSFLACATEASIPSIKKVAESVNYTLLLIGRTIPAKQIILADSDNKEILFDYSSQNIIMPFLKE